MTQPAITFSNTVKFLESPGIGEALTERMLMSLGQVVGYAVATDGHITFNRDMITGEFSADVVFPSEEAYNAFMALNSDTAEPIPAGTLRSFPAYPDIKFDTMPEVRLGPDERKTIAEAAWYELEHLGCV